MDFIFPAPLKAGDTIAITAFSSGVDKALHPRLDLCINHFKDKGYKVIEGECLRENHNFVSATPEKRANELMAFLTDDSIAAIVPPYGGEIAMEILPLLDFQRIKQAKPKWILGYSDISTVMCAISALTGWASLHCTCLMEMVPKQRDSITDKLWECMQMAEGQSFEQSASEYFQKNSPNWQELPDAPYHLDAKTQWKQLTTASDTSEIKGKLFGGCLDILVQLFETKYLPFNQMKNASQEPFILYLENAEFSLMGLKRALMSLEYRGVLDDLAGVVLGRNSGNEDNPGDLSYQRILSDIFSAKPYPVIYDTDIGHLQPNLSLINGATATIPLGEALGSIKQNF